MAVSEAHPAFLPNEILRVISRVQSCQYSKLALVNSEGQYANKLPTVT